jgi:tetratricopeptide (TPR) repeat protein
LKQVIGDIRCQQGRYPAAADCYRELLEAMPLEVQAWVSLGKCLLAEEQPSDAEQAFDQALSLNPNNSEANYYRAMLYVHAGETKKARAALQAAVRAAPAWETAAREDALLSQVYDEHTTTLLPYRRWWQFWKTNG